ncbi:hypothetical protein M758_4G252400 [Ceratodon purpureus]|nr:hypothetical protein M758_4G252400 [Ceratodon purpureus]
MLSAHCSALLKLGCRGDHSTSESESSAVSLCCSESALQCRSAMAMVAVHLSASSAGHHAVTRASGVGKPGSSGGVAVRAFEGKDWACGGVLACALKEPQPWRAREPLVVCRSAETASGSTSVEVATAGGVTEVDKDSFWPFVKDAGEKVVVLDMYTQWCGPCKLMLPKVIALSQTYDDVVFAKLDCNQDNKPLAKELGVKTVPTFKIFKNAEVVAEIRGAKYDELVKAIESARSSS